MRLSMGDRTFEALLKRDGAVMLSATAPECANILQIGGLIMVKSIAVVAGSYILSVVLVFCTDPLLSRLFPGDFVRGHIPSTTPLLASTGFFFVISILCAWVCARFAPSRPGRHVLWFLIVGEAMGLALTLPNWNKGWPHWYSISWLLLWPIGCWIGLLLAGRRTAEASPATS